MRCSYQAISKTNVLRRALLCVVCILSAYAGADDNRQRIVSIDGAITEIVFALDAGDQVVAVDETSQYPKEVATLPNVGYLRALSAEGILSLDATHILTTQDAGPPGVIRQLQAAKIPLTIIEKPYSLLGLYSAIHNVARVIGKGKEAKLLVQTIQNKVANTSFVNDTGNKPNVMFVMMQQGHRLNVAGTDTRADALIRLSGGENVVNQFASYKPLTQESALLLNPDIILVFSPQGEAFDIASHRALTLTKAYKTKHIYTLNGDELTFGVRLPDAMSKLHHWFNSASITQR